MRHARAFAAGRAGSVAFALVDGRGRMHGVRRHAPWYSASLLKPVLLGAYLTRPDVRYRPLRQDERALMEPMIRASADEPANTLFGRLGPPAIERFGHRLGLRSLAVAAPIWGSSIVTPAGYARFFRALPGAIGLRHRRFATRLLASIVPSQRWGVGRVRLRGAHVLFKGGWRAGRGYGRIVNQAARVACGRRVVALTILTDHDPTHDYGTATVAGVARRLLAPLRGRC